jgi:hypothetical protein
MITWISLQKRGRREENFTSPDHSHPDMLGTKNWSFVLLRTKLGFCASVKNSKPLRTNNRQRLDERIASFVITFLILLYLFVVAIIWDQMADFQVNPIFLGSFHSMEAY